MWLCCKQSNRKPRYDLLVALYMYFPKSSMYIVPVSSRVSSLARKQLYHKIAPVPFKQSWMIWVNESPESTKFNDISMTNQSISKPPASPLWYAVNGKSLNWVCTSLVCQVWWALRKQSGSNGASNKRFVLIRSLWFIAVVGIVLSTIIDVK